MKDLKTALLSLDIEKKVDLVYKRKYLDIFIDDRDEYVRQAVALQGYGLDKLINDPDFEVRSCVAEQGYGLDTLVNDSNLHVRNTAIRKMQNK